MPLREELNLALFDRTKYLLWDPRLPQEHSLSFTELQWFPKWWGGPKDGDGREVAVLLHVSV